MTEKTSDTDICPAYHKAKKCGVKIKYICFEGALNRGVAAATDETIKIPTDILKKYTQKY
ncbi:hypothetical protein IJI17_02420 [Candidatus Saccharibacteria bacterium]|nr:hypothetical protein [Candidatus Saccharibacteria bacterium]